MTELLDVFISGIPGKRGRRKSVRKGYKKASFNNCVLNQSPNVPSVPPPVQKTGNDVIYHLLHNDLGLAYPSRKETRVEIQGQPVYSLSVSTGGH